MKKRALCALLAVLLCVSMLPIAAFAADEVAINKTNFNDDTFREYVRGFDTDNSGGLSQSEIASVKEIKQNYEDITSLKGIEFFSSLEVLWCWGNGDLRELDVSKNTALKSLKCNSCAIETLDVSRNTELTDLSCQTNKLKKLDVSNNSRLETLFCNDNTLGKLDVGKNTALKTLYCYNCGLQALDISTNTRLERLECNKNSIQTLDISNNPRLIRVLLNNEYPNDPSAEEQHYYIDAENLHLFIDSGTHITFLSITSQPKNTTAASGKKATFSIAAVGNDLFYQWQVMRTGADGWEDLP